MDDTIFKDVTKVKMNKGDVLLVRVFTDKMPAMRKAQYLEQVKQSIKPSFPHNDIIVSDHLTDMTVISPHDQAQ